MDYIQSLRKKIGHDPIIMVTAGAIITQDQHILLQKRKDNFKWAIHGGALELGETLEEALIREVNEETGLRIKTFHFFKVFSGKDFKIIYPNQDIVYLVDHIYEITDFQGDFKPNEKEVLELKWFRFDDIPWDNLMSHNVYILKEYMLSKNKN